jgi:hypothetical protein
MGCQGLGYYLDPSCGVGGDGAEGAEGAERAAGGQQAAQTEVPTPHVAWTQRGVVEAASAIPHQRK